MTGDRCPHCGSEDYDYAGGAQAILLCLACGYDTENRESGVCPGGKHPNTGGQVCCDTCWNRPPRNLPDQPRWRSRRRSLMARRRKSDSAWIELEAIDKALLTWLRNHPRETSNP